MNIHRFTPSLTPLPILFFIHLFTLFLPSFFPPFPFSLFPPEPSNPPNNIIVHNGASDHLTFTIEPPIRPNGIIIAYNFYITFENGTTVVIPDYDATGTFVLEGLLPYQLVTVEVSANTSVGEGPRSDVHEIRTAQAG